MLWGCTGRDNAQVVPAAGARPDYDLKWALVRQSKRLRGGLSAIVIGSVLQMIGTLMDPLVK